MTKAENATLLAVGINCPPPRCNGSSDILASSTLNLTLRIATYWINNTRYRDTDKFLRSSQRGPSLAPH